MTAAGAERLAALRWRTLASVLALLSASTVSAQQLPAPRDMGLPQVRFEAPDPKPLQLRMDNGLVAYVVRDELVPLVRYTALIGAGSADGAGGVHYASALRAGPASLAREAFDSSLRGMAAELEVQQSHTETSVSLEVPTGDAARALELFAALLMEPRFGSRQLATTGAVDEATGESGPGSLPRLARYCCRSARKDDLRGAPIPRPL